MQKIPHLMKKFDQKFQYKCSYINSVTRSCRGSAPKIRYWKILKKSENQYFPQPLAGFLWCMSGKNHENPLGTRQKNIAPLPQSSSLLTLPQGSLATPYHVVTGCGTPGIKSKSWLNHTSDYDSNAIVANDRRGHGSGDLPF